MGHSVNKALKTLLILGLTVICSAAAVAEEIIGKRIFSTGPVPCDGALRFLVWANEGPTDLFLRRSQITIGVDRGTIADISAWMQRLSDLSDVHFEGWDHYAEPTAFNSSVHTFAPDSIRIGPGDAIRLRFRCTNLISGATRFMVIGSVWWITGP